MATFTTTFLPGPILECLIKDLAIPHIRSLQLTCQQYRDLYHYALPTKWRIDSHLSRWFLDPKAFRRQLQRCNAIISGSAALQYFDQPTVWQPSDLDVYLDAHSDLYGMHWHLVHTQGYIYNGMKTAEEAKYPVDGIREVRTFTRRSEQTGSAERVQLIVLYHLPDSSSRGCREHCISAILEGFHSTAVVNYLTATEAVSLFPQTTFVKRKTYLKKPYERLAEKAVQKYVDRGWVISDVLPREHKKALQPLRQARFVGDKLCWRIEYGVDGVSRQAYHDPTLWLRGPLWWTMNHQEHRVYRAADPGDIESPDPYRTVYVGQTHYYFVSCHGPLTIVDRSLYLTLGRLSAAHPSLRGGDFEGRKWKFYCDCESSGQSFFNPGSGERTWNSICQTTGLNEPLAPWCAESLGSCQRLEILRRMAEENLE